VIFTATEISGVYLIDLELKEDNRGGFARTFCQKEFEQINFTKTFVQINHSYNLQKGTLRGMHYQMHPYQESKLIRCISGSIIDVAVDIRKDSPTFLQHIKVELSANNRTMILIPEGCAHGFQTLHDNTELIYHHTSYFNPITDNGLNYSDPLLNIEWDLPISNISEKDKTYSLLTKKYKGI